MSQAQGPEDSLPRHYANTSRAMCVLQTTLGRATEEYRCQEPKRLRRSICFNLILTMWVIGLVATDKRHVDGRLISFAARNSNWSRL